MSAAETLPGRHTLALQDAADAIAAAALTIARRFAAGATLWCVAPGAGHHARHIAVEFVHPVIVGKRSLPAVAIADDGGPEGLVDSCRLLVRPGDLLVAVGSGADPSIAALVRRGDAWGVRTVLIATDERDHADTVADHTVADHTVADHTIWVGPKRSDCVLAYHLLWELAHVVFEHPGLLAEPVGQCRDAVCITCSDEGRVVEVRAVEDGHTVRVLAGGGEESVDTSVVGDVEPGDLLLVHAGLALTVLEPTS